nr:unnamed protein product [Digitaria exilis]
MDGGAPELLREASPWSVLAGAAAVLLLWWAAQVLDWAWLAPRRMERALRAQGLKGTRYRFLWGDLKEERRLAVEALSRPVPMGRPHDILPRVSPLLHRAVEERGKLSFTWFGTTPRVTIIDPELVREVTSNKDGNFVKTKLATRIVKLLIGGVAILDGEKWAKHRRIMNPAFHAEKLKVTMVLYEVLRLYPPALFLNRRTHKQTELGGVMYPPDVMFVIPIMFIHRDPVFWGPDAGEFNPGRFAEGVSKACSDPGAFIPFSWGPRVCIGQNFALLEAKLGISMILQRFAFELSPAYVHAPYNILTLHPQHSVLVRVRRL